MTSFRFRCIGLLAALWVSWGQGDAFAQRVYWTDVLNGKIQSANLDLTDVTTVFDTVSVLPQGFTHPARPAYLVVDPVAGWIYWTDLWSGVHRVKLDGTGYQNIVPITPKEIDPTWGPPLTLFAGKDNLGNQITRTLAELFRPDIQGIALDPDPLSNLLYWGPDHPFESPLGSPYLRTRPGDGSLVAEGHVRVSNPDGSAVNDIFDTGVDGYTSGLAIDFSRRKMYFSSPNSNYFPTNNILYRADLSGGNKEAFYYGGTECDPRDIKVDERGTGTLYWSCTEASAIMKKDLESGGVTTLQNNLGVWDAQGFHNWGPGGIALDPAHDVMYVVESFAGRVERRNLAWGYLPSEFRIVTESDADPRRQTCHDNDTNTDHPCQFFPQGVALDLTDPNKRPDMIVSNLSPSATTVGAGGDITVTETTQNLGINQAVATKTYIYLSTDDTLGPEDTFLGSRSVGVLDGGSDSTGWTRVTIPANAAQGPAYLIVLADGGKALLELHEDNNTSAQSITITAPPLPDLIVSALSAPTSAAPGTSITVTDTTTNQGNAQTAVSTTTRIYFSLHTTLDGTETTFGDRLVPALNAVSSGAGSSSSGSTTLSIPAGTAPGTYYLIAVADAAGSVGESNETNNTTTAPITQSIEVTPPPLPDLIVSALSAPGSADAGTSITVTDTTTNQGNAQAAASTTTRIYLDGTPIGARPVPILNAGGSNSGSTTFIIPRGTAPGTHSLIAVADDAGSVGESNETNNTTTGPITKSIVVTTPPPSDLIVSAISAPSSAAAGASITVTDTTKNQGTGQAKASKTCIFFSRDAILDATDTKIGERSVPILNAGSSSSFSTFPVAIPSGALPGTNYLILVADGGQVVGETNESNNTRTKSVFVTGPDLAVTALSAPSTITRGTQFTVKDTTKNQGALQVAKGSTTSFYLSTTATLGRGTQVLLPFSHTVPDLIAGASDYGTANYTIPMSGQVGTITVAPGTWYLIAVADSGTVVDETDENDNTRTLRVTVK